MIVVDKNIILNGKTITKELSVGLEAWKAGNWSLFGNAIGTTLKDTCAI
jgi:hypothetical protein